MRRISPWLLLVTLLVLCGLGGKTYAADQTVIPSTMTGNQAQAIQRAIYATHGLGTVTLPVADNYTIERHWDSTIFVQADPATVTTNAATSYCRVSLILKGNWRYNGTGPAIVFLGSKDHQECVTTLRLSNSNSTGILVGGDALHQSQNALWIHDSKISFTGSNCIGIQVGSATSNDVCDIVCERDAIESEVIGEGSQQDKLLRAHAAGNRGIQFAGPNTVHCAVRDCTVTGADVMVSTVPVAGQPGGSGLVIQNLGGSYNCLAIQNQAAFNLSCDGGRLELGCRVLEQGSPLVAGQAGASVSIRNVTVDVFDTSLAMWGDPLSLIGWQASGTLDVWGVNGYGNNWQAQKFVAVRCNGTGPGISIAGVFNKAGVAQTVVPVTAAGIVPVEGSLAVVK